MSRVKEYIIDLVCHCDDDIERKYTAEELTDELELFIKETIIKALRETIDPSLLD